MSNNNKFCQPLSYYVDFICYFLSLIYSDDAKIPKTNIELCYLNYHKSGL